MYQKDKPNQWEDNLNSIFVSCFYFVIVENSAP